MVWARQLPQEWVRLVLVVLVLWVVSAPWVVLAQWPALVQWAAQWVVLVLWVLWALVPWAVLAQWVVPVCLRPLHKLTRTLLVEQDLTPLLELYLLPVKDLSLYKNDELIHAEPSVYDILY
jgi:hypothetical protein